MAEKVKYSFIIPVYNREAYIVRCLDSIHHQTKQDVSFEVIVVDDGSTDETAKEYRSTPPKESGTFTFLTVIPVWRGKRELKKRGENIWLLWIRTIILMRGI